MLQSLLNASVHSLTNSYIVLYEIWKWVWSAFQTDQLTVAACIRLQPQNMEDESGGMTQTCTVRSDERFQRSHCTCMVKAGKYHFIKQLGRRNENADGQFVTSSSTAFLESSSRFLRSSLFSSTTSHTIQLFASVYLQQLMTSQKASSHHAMHDRILWYFRH